MNSIRDIIIIIVCVAMMCITVVWISCTPHVHFYSYKYYVDEIDMVGSEIPPKCWITCWSVGNQDHFTFTAPCQDFSVGDEVIVAAKSKKEEKPVTRTNPETGVTEIQIINQVGNIENKTAFDYEWYPLKN